MYLIHLLESSLILDVLFHCIDYHPHPYQLSLQRLYLTEELVGCFSEIDSGLLAEAMEIRMMRVQTERQEQPAHVLAPTQVISLKLF
jgi:hypothetical protein